MNPFDATQEVGMYAWRYASQFLHLADALAPKLQWLDHETWREKRDALREMARSFEIADRKRRGVSLSHRTPWSNLPQASESEETAEE